MGKVLKPLAIVAAIAVNVIPGVGQAISGAAFAALGGSTFAALGAALTIGSIATAAITIGGLSALSSLGRSRAGGGLTAFDPRSINADPAARRKIVLGRTAFPMDLAYAEPSGSNQEYVDYIFCLAGHRSEAIEEIWIEEEQAWTAGGGALGKYAGYLWIEVILNGSPTGFHTVNGGATWNSGTRFTGCTTMKVRIKRSDNSKSSQSPFGSGISGRWTTIGRAMPVYDPALDSTQPGGSGAQRADNRDTWTWTAGVARGDNPALQLLSYLLGWQVNGVGTVGVGLPADLIDIPSFAAAAALCDESVAVAGGGSRRRFVAGRAFSDDDDPMAVAAVLLEAMAGELVDDGGRLGLRLAVNDLTPALTLTDDDFVGGYEWIPQPGPDGQITAVRGQFANPATSPPFSLVDYPDVAVPRSVPVPRALPLTFTAVQDQRQAEALAKQAAGRSLYPGLFRVPLGPRGWQLQRNMVVQINSGVRGWTGKLFRVRELGFAVQGNSLVVEATLREENAAIYPAPGTDSPVVTPPAPVVFDSRAAASWLLAGIESQSTRNVARGPYDADTAYTRGDEVIFSGSSYRLIVDSSTGNAPPDAARWELFAAAGTGPPGAAGPDGITISSTNQSASVPTEADGSGGNYSAAGGQILLRRGTTLLAPTFSVVATSPAGGWISINSSTGVYTVTDPGATLGTATLRANVGGVNYDISYTITKTLKGVAGPNLTLVADGQAFTFTDGAASPGGQTITLNALLTNLSGTATWSATPAVTLGGSGNTRTLAVADFGTNRQVTVEATLGGITDRITLVRLERNIVAAANANRVPFSRFEGGRGWAIAPSSTVAGYAPLRQTIFGGRYFIETDATASAGDQDLFLSNSPDFQVFADERLSVGARVDAFNLSGALPLFWQFRIEFYNSSGFVDDEVIASGTGNITRDTLHQDFVQVPALATMARLVMQAKSGGTSVIRVAFLEPMVASAAEGQTAHPDYVPGPNAADGATLGAPAGTPVAGQEAAALVADAATAKANAASALSTLAAIADDGVLSRDEKPAVRQQRDTIIAVHPSLQASADFYLVSRTVADTAYNDLISYLAGLSPSLDTASDTAITRSTFNGRFQDYYDASTDLRDTIARVAGRNTNFIWRRTNIAPATPTGNGIPSGWFDEPPAGTDFLWFSKALQERDGTTIGAWSAPARQDGPEGPQGVTGVSAPPVKALPTGAAQFDPIRLENGQTVTVAAELFLNTGGVAGVCSLELQISPAGTGSWATMTGGTNSDSQPTTEPVELAIAGATFTNSSGAARLYDIRAVSERRSRSVNTEISAMRVL